MRWLNHQSTLRKFMYLNFLQQWQQAKRPFQAPRSKQNKVNGDLKLAYESSVNPRSINSLQNQQQVIITLSSQTRSNWTQRHIAIRINTRQNMELHYIHQIRPPPPPLSPTQWMKMHILWIIQISTDLE